MAVSGPKSLRRWLAILALLVVVALLTAERGVADLQGRVAEPSGMFRLSPAQNGEWTVTVLGVERRIPVARIVKALP